MHRCEEILTGSHYGHQALETIFIILKIRCETYTRLLSNSPQSTVVLIWWLLWRTTAV